MCSKSFYTPGKLQGTIFNSLILITARHQLISSLFPPQFRVRTDRLLKSPKLRQFFHAVQPNIFFSFMYCSDLKSAFPPFLLVKLDFSNKADILSEHVVMK